MIETALLLMFAQPDPMEAARVSYSNCIVKMTQEHLSNRSNKGQFERAAKSGCEEQRAAYINAVKSDEVEFGSTEAEAAKYAKEEADGIITAFVASYDGFLNSKTEPTLE